MPGPQLCLSLDLKLMPSKYLQVPLSSPGPGSLSPLSELLEAGGGAPKLDSVPGWF